MTDESTTAPPIGGVALLERAINYTLGSLSVITPEVMTRPTPCRAWDLRALLEHMDDSLAALHEATDVGYVPVVESEPARDPADLTAALRKRACRLLGAWTNRESDEPVSIGGAPLTAGMVTGTGAVEIAVHGWDVAQGCGQRRPIPSALAEEMLQLAPLFVTDADRPARFGEPVKVPPLASPHDRLVAFLGRQP